MYHPYGVYGYAPRLATEAEIRHANRANNEDPSNSGMAVEKEAEVGAGQDFCIISEAAKKAEMDVIARDMGEIGL